MKSLFFIIFLALFSFEAPSQEIFKILGREELYYHKEKISGPFYALNQALINELLEIDKELYFKEEVIQKLKETKFPSLALVEEVIINGHHSFVLKERIYSIFWELISSIQRISPTARCLDQEIPELKVLKEKAQFLELELKNEKIFQDKNSLKKIFVKLQNYEALFKKCSKPSLK